MIKKEDDDIDLIQDDECGNISARIKKELESQVCNILDNNTSILEMPKAVFSEESIDTEARSF